MQQIATRPAANPSSPSVKLTEFDEAIIIIIIVPKLQLAFINIVQLC